LLEELQAIGSLNGNSVLLIDDVELMESPPPPPHKPEEWPTMGQVKKALAEWGEELHTRVYQGPNSRIMVVTPERVG
jgi:hypothetical protein